ncbi:MAG: hypothetical protein L6V85_05125 [Clostridiales bacterium]|nr:MAG: hypothetical protein L6V85_05125 [Clostridiales bacterium]
MSDGDYEFISNVYPAIRDRVESIFGAEMNGYFVPYMWGTLGIMYNVEKGQERRPRSRLGYPLE